MESAPPETAGLPAARYKIAVIWPRLVVPLGVKVVALVPFMSPRSLT